MLTSAPSKVRSIPGANRNLPAWITRAASKQAYYTFRLLVRPEHTQDAYRAYAYFRWLDDQLDDNRGSRQEKLDLINRQQCLLNGCYRGEAQSVAIPEEQMLVDLVANDHEKSSRLQFYLRNMMAVMSFDVERRGRLITQAELVQYSRLLSMAVTELLFYFIDRDEPSPCNAARYQAVRGAHIAHMLRDMLDDIDAGYVNLPIEVLGSQPISAEFLHSRSFRQWVLERVRLAHQCFSTGRQYFKDVRDVRCRLAAYAYLARFEWMLRAIEKDAYRLRRAYPERKSFSTACWMAWRVVKSILKIPFGEDTAKQFVPVE
jgi:hypothetical protein